MGLYLKVSKVFKKCEDIKLKVEGKRGEAAIS
jgi:hypothetical protein